MNHFAYMPFPIPGPYISRRTSSDWLEFYAEHGLNVWTKTVFLGGACDDVKRRWTVRLKCPDGRLGPCARAT